MDDDECPKLSKQWFEGADAYIGDKLVRRGRPKLEKPKVIISIRLDSDLLEKLKEGGAGWQTRINNMLRASIIGQ